MRELWLLFPLLLVLTACGGPPSAEEIYAQSGEKMGALTSFRVAGEVHQQGVGPRFQVEYDLELPDRFRLSFHGERDGKPFSASVIVIADDLYVIPPESQDWFVVPKEVRSQFFYVDVAGIFNALLTQVSDLSYVGKESVAGVSTYHIRGSIGPEALALFHPAQEPPTENGLLDIWVGVQDSLVRQFKITEGEETGTLAVSGFNEVKVTAPANPRSAAELLALQEPSPGGAPVPGLPQTPEEFKAFIEALPTETQACLRDALGAAVFQELAAGARMPTFTEVSTAFGCLGNSPY